MHMNMYETPKTLLTQISKPREVHHKYNIMKTVFSFMLSVFGNICGQAWKKSVMILQCTNSYNYSETLI